MEPGHEDREYQGGWVCYDRDMIGLNGARP